MPGTRRSPQKSWPERHRDAIRLARDTIFAVTGLAMLAFETLARGEGRALIVGAALALCGLPMALRVDERRRS